jgi:hypothetical protein
MIVQLELLLCRVYFVAEKRARTLIFLLLFVVEGE